MVDASESARPLCVLHINTERTWRGGEQQTLYLARGLAERGHQSHVVAQPDKELHQRAEAAGLPVHPIAMRGEGDLVAISRIAKVLKTHRPDIVHMHTSHAHTLGVLASLWAGQAKRIVSRRVDFSIYRHRFSLSGLKYRFLVDRYIAISKAVRDAMLNDRIQGNRIDLVHSGIDTERFRGQDGQGPRGDWGVDAQQPVIGTIAHFGWHKGLEYLIRAAPRIAQAHPDVRIVIVGDGDLRPQLEEEIQRNDASRWVQLAGFRTDIGACLAAFDVFVMPSVMEGLCTSILDALSVEKPVVASKVGGIPEIIEHDRTGLLVPPKDPESLAHALATLIEDRATATRLGLAGCEKVRDRFSVDAMVEGSLKVYRNVLAS